jgi:hypothetical protein
MAYAVSVAAPSEHIQLGAAIVGTSLVCLGLLSLISAVWTKRNNARALKAIASFVEHDVAACFVGRRCRGYFLSQRGRAGEV